MQKNKKLISVVMVIIAALVIPFMGCAKKDEPAPDGKKDEEINQAQAIYVGSDKCYDCHTGIKEEVSANSHGTAFKSLESFNVEIDENIKVYEEVKDGEPKTHSLKAAKIAGVMSDKYLIGTLDDKHFRVAGVKMENGQWKLEPADSKDINNDGTEDWIIKGYTCGDCHSPGLAKGSEQAAKVEPGFGCESCHGPGSIHVTTKAKDAISDGKEACINCHTASEPTVEGEFLIAQNHYGTRSWFDSNHNKGSAADCLTCHTSHSVNSEGKMLKQNSAQEVCGSCHGKAMNAEDFMWINPTDARGHFTKDHSFGKYPYEVYDDDPETKPVEIRNPDTINKMKKKMTK